MPPFAARLVGIRSSAIRDLLTVAARDDITSLAGGLPDPALVPRERIRQVADEVLRELASVQYTETTGWAGLRAVLAEREGKRIGRALTPDEVVVTHGSQQALSLLGQVLLDPGATVIVENPAYTGALQVFAAAQARIEAVPLNADGMDVDALTALLDGGTRPVLVHTVPNFHNPGAVTMAPARRERLAELADRFDFWVVEDDPYGELWFDAPPPAPVAAYSERVIRLSSASKILAPALRTGWLTAPESVCRAVELVKQGADLCGSALTQQIVARLLSDGPWLDAHLDSVRAVYRERAAALLAAVHREFGARVDVAPVRGGMFCWLEFRDGTDTTDLLTAALANGVAFVPGAAFAVTDGYRNALRLCFATADAAVLDDAVTRLAVTRLTGTRLAGTRLAGMKP